MKKRARLPRELAEPINLMLGLADGLANALLSKQERASVLDEWLRRVRAERLLLLFKHYGFDIRDPLAFNKLAIALAMDYVPGFRIADKGKRPRGWPHKWHSLLQALDIKGKPGRPKSWLWNGKEGQLLAVLEDGKTLLKQKSQRVTNEAALFAIYRHHLPSSAAEYRVRGWAKKDAKRLAEARKALRKSAGK